MEPVLAPLIVCSLLLSPAMMPPVFTSAPNPLPIASAIRRDVPRLVTTASWRAPEPAQAPSTERPNWMSRHPALVGALIGAGAGTIYAGVAENELLCSGGDEDCLFYGGTKFAVGAGIGAGIGALVGMIVGLAR